MTGRKWIDVAADTLALLDHVVGDHPTYDTWSLEDTAFRLELARDHLIKLMEAGTADLTEDRWRRACELALDGLLHVPLHEQPFRADLLAVTTMIDERFRYEGLAGRVAKLEAQERRV